MAIQFVILNFVILTFYGVIYAIEVYQSRLMWMVLLLAIPCGFAGILKIRSIRARKKNEPKVKLSFEQKTLLFTSTLASLGVIISALMITNYASEEMVAYFFVTGTICMVFWLASISLIKIKKEKAQTICEEPL